jgi:hypothetical protein
MVTTLKWQGNYVSYEEMSDEAHVYGTEVMLHTYIILVSVITVKN